MVVGLGCADKFPFLARRQHAHFSQDAARGHDTSFATVLALSLASSLNDFNAPGSRPFYDLPTPSQHHHTKRKAKQLYHTFRSGSFGVLFLLY